MSGRASRPCCAAPRVNAALRLASTPPCASPVRDAPDRAHHDRAFGAERRQARREPGAPPRSGATSLRPRGGLLGSGGHPRRPRAHQPRREEAPLRPRRCLRSMRPAPLHAPRPTADRPATLATLARCNATDFEFWKTIFDLSSLLRSSGVSTKTQSLQVFMAVLIPKHWFIQIVLSVLF